jgi:hypothetical protein
MKNFLLLITLISSISFGQTVRNSTGNGDFFNPLTWSPAGIPADGDSLFIDHIVTMTVGIPYTMGRITVNTPGTLTDGGSGLDIYCNGGSLVNHGQIICNDIWLDSGELENHGNFLLDSMWTQGTVINTGTMAMNDYLSDENEIVTNDGTIRIANNYNNQGLFYNNGNMFVGNNYSNWNFQTSDATYECDGLLCVTGDWSNFNAQDTVRGSGQIYIGGASTNLGLVQGTLSINTPTGAFTFDTGTVDGSVTFGTATCAAGIESSENLEFKIYPNPATHKIMTDLVNCHFEVSDINGRIAFEGEIVSGSIDISELGSGMYVLRIKNESGQIGVKTFMKN